MFKAKLQTRAGGAAAIAADDERSARGQGRDGSGQQAQARQRTRKQRPRHILPQIRSSRSEEHTSELQSLMRISYAVFCLKNKKEKQTRFKVLKLKIIYASPMLF